VTKKEVVPRTHSPFWPVWAELDLLFMPLLHLPGVSKDEEKRMRECNWLIPTSCFGHRCYRLNATITPLSLELSELTFNACLVLNFGFMYTIHETPKIKLGFHKPIYGILVLWKLLGIVEHDIHSEIFHTKQNSQFFTPQTKTQNQGAHSHKCFLNPPVVPALSF
jgi:hypothetical protein